MSIANCAKSSTCTLGSGLIKPQEKESERERESETDAYTEATTALVTSAAATRKYVCEKANRRNKP